MKPLVDLYKNSKRVKSTSEFAKNKYVTLVEIRDIFEHSDVADSDNPFKVTYMCEEDYDELYELQSSLSTFGFTLTQYNTPISKADKIFSTVWNISLALCVLATLVLGILKLCNVLAIGWFIVFIPMISIVAVVALVAVVATMLALIFLREEDETSDFDKME